jgi:hypothetical protein
MKSSRATANANWQRFAGVHRNRTLTFARSPSSRRRIVQYRRLSTFPRTALLGQGTERSRSLQETGTGQRGFVMQFRSQFGGHWRPGTGMLPPHQPVGAICRSPALKPETSKPRKTAKAKRRMGRQPTGFSPKFQTENHPLFTGNGVFRHNGGSITEPIVT